MVTRFKIILIVLSLITPTILMGHKVTLEDKSLEEIVNNRMALMQKVKSTSSQIFRLLKTNDYEAILELNETLLHAASDFKDHYPEGSQHKGASEEIWNDRETFNELTDKFVINYIGHKNKKLTEGIYGNHTNLNTSPEYSAKELQALANAIPLRRGGYSEN